MTLPAERAAHKLGPWTATALVVGNIIGVGIFVLPVSLAPYGWGTLLGWAVTLTGSLCLAWVFAQLAQRVPEASGTLGAVRVALGSDLAFLTAWGYWVSVWVANAVIVIGGVNYLSGLVPALARSRPLAAGVELAVLWSLSAVNLRGVRAAGQVQLVSTVLKLWAFVAALLAAVLLVTGSAPVALAPFAPSQLSWGVATTTATLTLYSMLGIESAAIPAGAVADPVRNVPHATMAGTLIAGLVNMLLCSAIVLLMPAAQLAASAAPLVDFVVARLGPVAGLSVSLAGVISAFGCLNGWVLLAGEIPTAMAEAGELPAWWAVRNGRGASVNAQLVATVLTSVLVVLNATPVMASVLTFAVLLSTATALVLYLLVPIGTLVFVARGVIPRRPALLVASGGAIGFAMWAIIGAGAEALGWGAVLIAAGWPLYRVVRRRVRPSP